MNQIIENVFSELSLVQPRNWEKVCLYSQITNDSYEFVFYTLVEGRFVQCFALEKEYNISRNSVRGCFDKLYQILLSDYNEKKWFVQTLVFENNGHFNLYYDYDDHSANTIEYKQIWKDKYVK